MKNTLRIQELVNDLARVKRHHYVAKTNERENDVHHSYSVAVLAWQIHDSLGLDLDMAKVMKYSLVHDTVEV